MPSPIQHAERSPVALDLGRIAVLAVGALLIWQLRGIVLLGFTSVLIAVTLRAISDPLARRTRAPPWLALAFVILITILFLAGALALFGWRVADQYDEILARAWRGWAEVSALVNSHTIGRNVLQWMQGAKIEGATAMLTPALGSVLGSVGQGLAYTAIVIASGIFLAIEPQRHLRGVLLVVPAAAKPIVEAFLQRSAAILHKWLVSRLIVMVSIGVLSSLGLWALGIDGAFTLGLIGGLLTFIPLVGALLAAVPAILVAFAQSPLLAVYVGLMYWAVHFVEGTFITPYVQDAEVDLPPVLTMYSTVIFAALFGTSGIFLASPLALLVIVAIQVFYLKSPPAPIDPRRRKRSQTDGP
jgi:predicted PurR-regulated permease PerM